MAKAALNMLTRTSAEDLAAKHRIFMNSVDTGWINDENPLEKAKKTAETNLFQTPIDEIDAAARIVDREYYNYYYQPSIDLGPIGICFLTTCVFSFCSHFHGCQGRESYRLWQVSEGLS